MLDTYACHVAKSSLNFTRARNLIRKTAYLPAAEGIRIKKKLQRF